ncbi:hypothetical protein CsatB_023550 [Cannabis sativa]
MLKAKRTFMADYDFSFIITHLAVLLVLVPIVSLSLLPEAIAEQQPLLSSLRRRRSPPPPPLPNSPRGFRLPPFRSRVISQSPPPPLQPLLKSPNISQPPPPPLPLPQQQPPASQLPPQVPPLPPPPQLP